MAETSGLTLSEFASVLAPSGTTGQDNQRFGNSWKFAHFADALSTQKCDAASAARDSEARKSEALVAAVENWTCLDSQKPRDDVHHQIDEYGQDDDAYYEHDVEWHTGDARDELEEPAYTVGLRTDDPELLEQFDGNLEDADASASRVYASASLSFQEAVPGLLSC